MTRKRFIKLLMAFGTRPRIARELAKPINGFVTQTHSSYYQILSTNDAWYHLSGNTFYMGRDPMPAEKIPREFKKRYFEIKEEERRINNLTHLLEHDETT